MAHTNTNECFDVISFNFKFTFCRFWSYLPYTSIIIPCTSMFLIGKWDHIIINNGNNISIQLVFTDRHPSILFGLLFPFLDLAVAIFYSQQLVEGKLHTLAC